MVVARHLYFYTNLHVRCTSSIELKLYPVYYEISAINTLGQLYSVNTFAGKTSMFG